MPLTPEQQETVLRHQDAVLRIARAMRWWDDDAPSVALLALCEAVEAGVPQAYLVQRVRNRMKDYVRNEKPRTHGAIMGEPKAGHVAIDLDEALAVLSEEERDIFYRRYVRNESAERIGLVEGISARQVRRILARCRTLVRDHLGWTPPRSSTSATTSTTPRR